MDIGDPLRTLTLPDREPMIPPRPKPEPRRTEPERERGRDPVPAKP